MGTFKPEARLTMYNIASRRTSPSIPRRKNRLIGVSIEEKHLKF
jgi:hypothetical protein